MYFLFNECIIYLFKLKVVYHNNKDYHGGTTGLKSCSCGISPLCSVLLSLEILRFVLKNYPIIIRDRVQYF